MTNIPHFDVLLAPWTVFSRADQVASDHLEAIVSVRARGMDDPNQTRTPRLHPSPTMVMIARSMEEALFQQRSHHRRRPLANSHSIDSWSTRKRQQRVPVDS